ncbi:MAG: GTPase Era [Spirochaetes bacterium]|nr:MAG: GTPase Era [Spirochaetota bacterium]
MKFAFIAVIGRPSSGKSTFINTVCGEKVSIVSNVPQTTRNKIRGIYNSSRGQLVFIDTPGFNLSEKKFNQRLNTTIQNVLKEVDILLYLVDATRMFGQEENELLLQFENYSGHKIIVINKIDIQNNILKSHRKILRERFKDIDIFEISSLTGIGIDRVIDKLFQISPEGERQYPDDFYTDQEPVFRISEIIREKVILETREEIPHSIYIDILDTEFLNATGEGISDTMWVRALVIVERETQKGIVIGHRGSKIKKIRIAAEKELSALFPYRIKLDLRVKVRKNWRKNDHLLNTLLR